jgi:hypothetical protein
MLNQAGEPRVSVGWLMQQLGERSAVIAFIPGASTVMGVLIAWPAVQMMLGHDDAALPRLIARKQIGVERLARIIGIVAPRPQVGRTAGTPTPRLRQLLDLLDRMRRELGGRDLGCYCALDQPCHADVLLELANATDLAARTAAD